MNVESCPTCKRPFDRRTLDQNSKMWPMLNDIAKQVVWHGYKLSPGEWKEVMSAGLKRQKVVPGLDGGFVVIGSSTSRMTKQEMSDLIDLIGSFGVLHDVKWTEQVMA